MNGWARQSTAIAAFELRRIARSPATVVGAVAFAVLLALGHWLHWTAAPPRSDGDRLFGYAYIAAMIASLRIGFVADRETGFDRYLVGNLIAPGRYVVGKLQAFGIYVIAFGLYAFLLALTLSAGEWTYAAWYASLFSLIAWVFLPAIVLVESLMTIRNPVAVVFVGFVITLATVEPFYGVEVVIDSLGLRTERFAFASLAPLVLRGVIGSAMLVVIYPLVRLRTTAPPG